MMDSPNTGRLIGQHINLVPLDPGRHAKQLYIALHGTQKDELWRYLRDGPFADADAHRVHLERLCASGQFIGFIIVDQLSETLLGQLALMKYSTEHRSVEIGYVLFLPALQRTRGGTEALYLLLRHCFETLGLRRLEWRCDSANDKSERAALRLGFQREGLLLQHMLVKGRSRDTTIFSLLDWEWPSCKTALLTWLDDSNFDSQGIARSSLENIMLSRRSRRLR
ncbi:GNAT family N-acetyltransferase [Agrobacterium sp. SHOUNA12C]|nr:GNAT family N-acetyltransferase [Agrobacterium sp. BETTINA12B]MCJ9760370.1 GNAT family N-acetyltransferase [Agrobacterium sp. SHOUNA12C]